MKKITKNLLSKAETVNEIKNEIELLKQLDHPNIVKIFEFFVEYDGYYLITEYLQGGELFDAIKKNGSFFEPIAANIMYQIFSAINYCHSINIIHRDLKPENILIDSINQNTGFLSIKIIDFGTAKIYEKNKNENKIIGSSYYIAPEVLEKNYNEKCDIWSCGVILYTLLSGKLPFTGRKQGEILRKILLGKYNMKGDPFDSISYEGKDLVKKCLEKNVQTRISARDALLHPWFNKYQTRQYFCQVTKKYCYKRKTNYIFNWLWKCKSSKRSVTKKDGKGN
jgi:calcium-dependent protein kinase